MTLDERYAAAVEAAELYALTWWAEPATMAASRLRRDPSLRPVLRARAEQGHAVTTQEVFRDASGWDSERRAEHDRVLGALGSVAADPGAPPHVYFTLGPPGSGKTKVLRAAAVAHARATSRAGGVHASDADDVRASLPEYAGGLGSQVVQDEVVVLTYGPGGYPPGGGLQQRVLSTAPGTAVLVVDIVGDPARLPDTAEALADRGWNVYALLGECPVDVCVERVKQRAVDTGRIVSLDYVRGVRDKPARALAAAVATGRLAGWAAVDTSGPPSAATVVRSDTAGTFGPVGGAVAPPAAAAVPRSSRRRTETT